MGIKDIFKTVFQTFTPDAREVIAIRIRNDPAWQEKLAHSVYFLEQGALERIGQLILTPLKDEAIRGRVELLLHTYDLHPATQPIGTVLTPSRQKLILLLNYFRNVPRTYPEANKALSSLVYKAYKEHRDLFTAQFDRFQKDVLEQKLLTARPFAELRVYFSHEFEEIDTFASRQLKLDENLQQKRK